MCRCVNLLYVSIGALYASDLKCVRSTQLFWLYICNMENILIKMMKHTHTRSMCSLLQKCSFIFLESHCLYITKRFHIKFDFILKTMNKGKMITYDLLCIYVSPRTGTGPVLELGLTFCPMLELGHWRPRTGTVPLWGVLCWNWPQKWDFVVPSAETGRPVLKLDVQCWNWTKTL